MEIEKLVRQISLKSEIKTGEKYPDSAAPVITANGDDLYAEVKQWGFPNFKGSSVVFNARSETAAEKNMFRSSLRERRCVIPARHFYEWDKAKQKVAFYDNNEPIIYMAGFYNTFKDQSRYVILTTSANVSMADVHNRMPVMLKKNEIGDWIQDNRFTEFVLQRVPYSLSRSMDT
jgi:putative SOS response-associated peptidase YedK